MDIACELIDVCGEAIISLFVEEIFPAINLKIPCFLVQGICLQVIEFPDRPGARVVFEGPNSAKFPVYFPVSREFRAETGSQWTASSASFKILILK
jgi:hypothetical protein